MDYLLFSAGIVLCAVLTMRASRLLEAALWLAGVSVFTALILYQLGAWEVAVIELSVGAGLVTVLFVFAIAVAGDDTLHLRSFIPKPFAGLLMTLALCLLVFLVLPNAESQTPVISSAAGTPTGTLSEPSFTTIFWQDRILDVLLQLAMIFTGVLGVLGLLAEPKLHTVPSLKHLTEQPTADLEREEVSV